MPNTPVPAAEIGLPSSRRRFLSGLASAPAAVAAGVVFNSSATSPARADTIAQMRGMLAQMYPLLDRSAALNQRADELEPARARLFRQLVREGVPDSDAFLKAADASGWSAAHDSCVDAQDALHELTERLWACDPRTLPELSLMAQALKLWDLNHAWEETDEEADWDDLMIRRFFDRFIAASEQRED